MPTTLSRYTQQELDAVAIVVFVVASALAVFFGRRTRQIWKGDI